MDVSEIRRRLKDHHAALRAEGVRSLAVFGSVARGEAGADSDIDILVEFDLRAEIGLIRYVGLQNRLSEFLGRKVDLVSRDALDRLVRDRVNAEARRVF